MAYINRLAKSKWFNFYPVNISIGCSIDWQIFPVFGPDVQTHMIMVSSQFAKIGSEADGNFQWVSEHVAGIIGQWKKLP